jgi:hypothetical protein
MDSEKINILVNHNIKVYNKMVNIIENLNPNLNIKITNIPSLENDQFYFSFSISNKKFYTIMSNFSEVNLINIQMVGNDKNNVFRLLKIFENTEELSEYFISKYVKIENNDIKYDNEIIENTIQEFSGVFRKLQQISENSTCPNTANALLGSAEMKPICYDKLVDTNDLYEKINNNSSINLLDLDSFN